jgi:hypothetical protein
MNHFNMYRLNDWQLRIMGQHDMIARDDRFMLSVPNNVEYFKTLIRNSVRLNRNLSTSSFTNIDAYEAYIWFMERVSEQ